MNDRLYRSRDERVLAGVAGGLADYFDVDPSLVRVVWVLLALFTGGAFLIVYIVMALIVPEEPWEGYGPGGIPPGATPGQAPPGATPATTLPPSPQEPGNQFTGWGAQRAAWRAERATRRAQRRAERAERWARGERPGQTSGLIVGLVLLVIGVVFLVPIVFPGFSIGRYWPLILVVLGILLIVAAFRPAPPPPGGRPG